MKSINFLAFVFSLAPFVSSAQFSVGLFPLFNEEADFSYLPYWASPVSGLHGHDAAFTPVAIASRPVMVRIPVIAETEEEKIYRISETGAYEYRFMGHELMHKSKLGFKPITAHTFFLETSRKGIIPPDITYRDFAQMCADDQRALIEAREEAPLQEDDFEYVHATLTYQTAPGGMKMVVANEEMEMELTCGMTPGTGAGKMVAIKYLPRSFSAPQMVKFLIDPWNNYQLNGHAYYKNVNSVFNDISLKLAQ